MTVIRRFSAFAIVVAVISATGLVLAGQQTAAPPPSSAGAGRRNCRPMPTS